MDQKHAILKLIATICTITIGLLSSNSLPILSAQNIEIPDFPILDFSDDTNTNIENLQDLIPNFDIKEDDSSTLNSDSKPDKKTSREGYSNDDAVDDTHKLDPTNNDDSSDSSSAQSNKIPSPGVLVNDESSRSVSSMVISAATSCEAYICVNPGDTVTIQFTCYNVDPAILVKCLMLDGPPGATFSSPTGNPVTATMTWGNANPPGTYQATFQAINVFCPPDYTGVCELTSVPVTNTIFVNSPPRANAGPSPLTLQSGDTITIQGSGSDDDGDALTYSWSPATSLNNPSIASPEFTAPNVKKETSFTYQLVVNDGMIDSDPSSVNIIVKPNKGEPDECEIDGPQQASSPSSSNSLSKVKEKCKPQPEDCTKNIKKDLTEIRKAPDNLYFIEASSLEEAASQFVIDPTTGGKYASYTTWSGDQYEPHVNEQGLVDCKTGKLLITVTTTYPVWTTGFDDLSSKDKKIWIQFLKDVFKHEQGHVDIVHKGYKGLGGFDYVINSVIGMTKQDAVNFIDGIARDTLQASVNYDADTGHGPILIKP